MPCRSLIVFFHLFQKLRENGLFGLEIDAMYKEMPEIVKHSCLEEKNVSDKYLLSLMLSDMPIFEKCIPPCDVPDSMTLKDINNIYLTGMILDRSFLIPEIVGKTIWNIVRDQKRMDELLGLLNPCNMGLGNYAGGFAWVMMQFLIRDDNNSNNKKRPYI